METYHVNQLMKSIQTFLINLKCLSDKSNMIQLY